MLREYISGNLLFGEKIPANSIARLLICGNSISKEAHDKDQHYKVNFYIFAPG